MKPKANIYCNLNKGYLGIQSSDEMFSWDYFGMWIFGFETLEEWFTYLLMDLNDKYNLTDVTE